MQRFWRTLRFTLLIAAFLLLAAYLFTMTPWRQKLGWGPDYHDLVQEGDGLVVALDRFHAQRGLWPEYLDDLTPPFLKQRPSPKWNYTVDPGRGPALATPTNLARTNVGYDFLRHEWRVFGEQDNRVLAPGPPPEPAATQPATTVVTEELAELDRRIAREPTEMDHRRGKASLLRSLDRLPEARDVIEAAARAMPEHYWPPLALATLELPNRPPPPLDATQPATNPATPEPAPMSALITWTLAHPGFTHACYLALAQRLSGDNAAAAETLRAALTQPITVDADDPNVLSFYLYDAARFALETQRWDLAIALCDAWQKAAENGEGAGKPRESSYRALRAAAELARRDFAAAQADLTAATASSTALWAGNLDALRAAVQKRDAAYRYAPGGPPPYRVFALPE